MLQGSIPFFVQICEANALRKKNNTQYDEFLSFMCICNIFILKKVFAIFTKNLNVFMPFAFIIHKAKQHHLKLMKRLIGK